MSRVVAPDEGDLLAAVRVLLRHPAVKEEVAAIVAEELGARAAAADAYVPTAEAARFLGVEPETVLGWARTGLLEAVRPPGTRGWRFRSADLRAFVERRGDGPPRTVDLSKERAARADKIAASVKGAAK